MGTVNKNVVDIGQSIRIWFSYETPIAFSNGGGFYCSENVWTNTTGKFLNELQPNKKKRIPNDEFNKKLEKVFERIKLV